MSTMYTASLSTYFNGPRKALAIANIVIFGVFWLIQAPISMHHKWLETRSKNPLVYFRGYMRDLIVLFLSIRITGNAVYLSAEHSTNLENLLIGAAVLSGVGTTPLLGEMGRFILECFNAEGNRTNAKLHKESHIVFKITVGLILVAISLSASGSGVPKQALTKAASIVIPIIYILILGFATSILFRYRFTSWRIQKAFYIACAVFPFLAVRVIYLILSAWQVDNNKYNSFIGSVHVAAGMELAMEVIIIALYMASRFVLAPLEKKTDEETLQSNESFRGKEAPERA